MAKKFSLKSLFIQDSDADEAASKQEQQTAGNPVSSAAPASQRFPAPLVSSAMTQSGTSPSGGKEDAMIRDSLLQALEQANQQGYDYFEFARAVEQQKSIIESEQVRFQASHAAAAVMGVTPDLLLQSANYYISVLKAKEKEFNDALKQNTTAEVEQRQKEMARIEGELVNKTEMITKLTHEIAELQKTKNTLAEKIETSKQKIESIRANFMATYSIFITKITSDIEKIKQYLPR
ncbi:MAG: hypothetical protein JW795_23525 [Chitinivibrionales bacterium]|nr:hypothetical protein [Chitinivibrionales bacterium]